MALVMRNNIFEWGDLYFLQLCGTVMGTSSAVMWAMIYYCVHEVNTLLPQHGHLMPLYKRFIDDNFGLHIGADAEWDQFKRDVNSFGILEWEFEERSLSVDFLDLTISIEGNRITTRTFQKPMNLYQYLPPTSAHPPWMMRGIIYSLMKKYRRQVLTVQPLAAVRLRR